jgi:hypothetical protein
LVPYPDSFTLEQQEMFLNPHIRHEFIVLSYASISQDPRIGLNEFQGVDSKDLLQNRVSAAFHGIEGADPSELDYIHDIGHFDTRVCNTDNSYCLFNVMMLSWDEQADVAFRVTVGRVHIDAFLRAEPVMKQIILE